MSTIDAAAPGCTAPGVRTLRMNSFRSALDRLQALPFRHRGGLHAHSFDVAGLLLRHHGRCASLDLRGHGESDWAGPRGYGTISHAADIERVAESLGTRPVVLIAHSLGVMAAMTWAGTRPPHLTGLLVICVGPTVDAGAGRSAGEMISQRPSIRRPRRSRRLLGTSRSVPEARSGIEHRTESCVDR